MPFTIKTPLVSTAQPPSCPAGSKGQFLPSQTLNINPFFSYLYFPQIPLCLLISSLAWTSDEQAYIGPYIHCFPGFFPRLRCPQRSRGLVHMHFLHDPASRLALSRGRYSFRVHNTGTNTHQSPSYSFRVHNTGTDTHQSSSYSANGFRRTC